MNSFVDFGICWVPLHTAAGEVCQLWPRRCWRCRRCTTLCRSLRLVIAAASYIIIRVSDSHFEGERSVLWRRIQGSLVFQMYMLYTALRRPKTEVVEANTARTAFSLSGHFMRVCTTGCARAVRQEKTCVTTRQKKIERQDTSGFWKDLEDVHVPILATSKLSEGSNKPAGSVRARIRCVHRISNPQWLPKRSSCCRLTNGATTHGKSIRNPAIHYVFRRKPAAGPPRGSWTRVFNCCSIWPLSHSARHC